MSESTTVVQVNAANFQREVIERSRSVPVVLDFWAAWCGPCKTLTPVLEKLNAHDNALAPADKPAWILAKVDTDANPELAQAFQIQSIPQVMAVQNGRIVDGFAGALPEREVRAFLSALVPGAAPSAAAEAKELEAQGDRAGAIALLRQALREGEDADARIALCALLLADGKAGEAQLVFDKLGEAERASAAATSVRAQLELAQHASGLDAARVKHEADPDDLAARIEYGRALLAAHREEEGLELLLEAVSSDPKFEDGAARKAMLSAFEALGPDHPLTVSFRFRLQMVLLV